MGTSGRKRSATLRPVRKKRLVKKIIRTRRSKLKKPRSSQATIPDLFESLEAQQPVASEGSPSSEGDPSPPESAPARADDSLAQLTSEVAVTSETVAAILSSLTEHLTDDKLIVKTHSSQQVEADGFPEWSQMQQELQGQGSALVDQPVSDPTSPVSWLVSCATEWSRERPVYWTTAVFLTGLLIGGLLAKLA